MTTTTVPSPIPASGFIWDRAQSSGISYRDYGEWCVDEDDHPGLTRCYVRGLKDHYDPHYVDGIGAVTDQKRIEEWEREFHEFEQNGNLPQFTIMHLPNDHTLGTRPGRPTPRAMVADNDFALGRLVEVVSHSRFWPETAIFVLEDDAQDGPDHVDAHRSFSSGHLTLRPAWIGRARAFFHRVRAQDDRTDSRPAQPDLL